ncbi:MAG: GNAT family N-acetyltransferase [Pyrinomonadaceae bacterium]|nr:GNAT family N-acetyltransferase [Pyrinomonadaceae bacterium]
MAVLPKLRDFWSYIPFVRSKPEPIVPFVESSPPDSLLEFAASYELHPLTLAHLDELNRLVNRCFVEGEAYSRNTLDFLLSDPKALCYRAVLKSGSMAGFVISVLETDGTGHITTIGIAPEHRRHGLAYRLLERCEKAYRLRNVRIMRLEVRTINIGAQKLYRRAGYVVMQRLPRYYANGSDGLMMVKSLA